MLTGLRYAGRPALHRWCHCCSALLLFGKPAIALLLQLFDQREIARLHNPSLIEHMDIVRLDIVKDALIVGDNDKARLPSRRAFTPCETIFRASISNPESDSSRMHSSGSSTAICKISLRFFTAGEANVHRAGQEIFRHLQQLDLFFH